MVPPTTVMLVVAGGASMFMAWSIGAGSSGSTPFAPAVGANAISVMRAGFVVGILGSQDQVAKPGQTQWDGHGMVACPAGYEPFEQRYLESGRISGRMDKEFCDGCPLKENCFVTEKQQFYSYGFDKRRVELAQRRKRMDDPAEKEFLNLRAGAESLVNEVYHQDGEKTRFTGTIKVKHASIAKAIGTNLKRASRFLESEAQRKQSAG